VAFVPSLLTSLLSVSSATAAAKVPLIKRMVSNFCLQGVMKQKRGACVTIGKRMV
jgi:hypothetical protein